MSNSVKELGIKELSKLTHAAARHHKATEFAGYLTREDDDAVYVADMQGTWIISRDDVMFIEDWEVDTKGGAYCPPEYMRETGKPVRVGIKEGATIYEIRPWHLQKSSAGKEMSKAMEKIFMLGGAPLPIGERTILGETQLAALERMFERRLGWSPNDPGDDSIDPLMIRRCCSGTWVLYNGYCDVDERF